MDFFDYCWNGILRNVIMGLKRLLSFIHTVEGSSEELFS